MKEYDCKICVSKYKDNGHWCMNICKGDEYVSPCESCTDKDYYPYEIGLCSVCDYKERDKECTGLK